ncbi:hypothetical protein VCUG_01308 [Vavraia culicis subsp. floridensis]|uniref:E3 ubiquitin-protein ligase listerin n=1 Tax=Vavraia culicis (isolate floridensis) TaxID=948595 RepID=L2GV82_VAVCU|nr:uncharacterized protein VCUG_01308 [Vavraia culicis subsp. floridensis]ELA47208.1 hypothetical protein VCUG_01308 [Vavraia culicis subsp. floridensis]
MNIFSDNPEFDENFYSIVKRLNKKSVATRRKAFESLFESFSSLPVQSNMSVLKDVIVQNIRGELRRESTRLLALVLDYNDCHDVLCYWFVNFLEDRNDKYNSVILDKVDLKQCGNIMREVDKNDSVMVLKAHYTLLRYNCTELIKKFVYKSDETGQLVDHNISDEFRDMIQTLDCNNAEIYKMVVFILIKMHLPIPEVVISVTNPSLIDIKYKIIQNRRLPVELVQFYGECRYLNLEGVRYVDENYKLEYSRMKVIRRDVFEYIMCKLKNGEKRDVVLYYINESVEYCNVFEHFNDFDVLNEQCSFDKVNEFLVYLMKDIVSKYNSEENLSLMLGNLILRDEDKAPNFSYHKKDAYSKTCVSAKSSHDQTIFTYNNSKECFDFANNDDVSRCNIVLYADPLIYTLCKLNLQQILVRSNLLKIKVQTISSCDSTTLETINSCLDAAIEVIDKKFFVEHQEYFRDKVLYRRYPDLITNLKDVDEELVHMLTEEQQREYGRLIIGGEKQVLGENIPKILVLPCLYRKYLDNNDISCASYGIDTKDLLLNYLDHKFVIRFCINEKDIFWMLSTFKFNNSVFYTSNDSLSNSFFYRTCHVKPFSCQTYKKLRALRKTCKHFQFIESLKIINIMLNVKNANKVEIKEENIKELGVNKVFCTSDDVNECLSICKFIHSRNNDDKIYTYRELENGVLPTGDCGCEEYFHDDLDAAVDFYEECESMVTHDYVSTLPLSYRKMCYIRVVNRIIKSGYFKFTVLHSKKKEIYLVNNFVIKPHYIENENLSKLRINLNFIKRDKLLRVRYFKRNKHYELEKVIERLSNDIFNTYTKMKNKLSYSTMMKVINHFEDNVWYYVFIRSVSKIRNISTVLFLEKMISCRGKGISGNINIEEVNSLSVLNDSENRSRGRKQVELSKFLVQQRSSLFKCVREEFAYNFPSLLPFLTNDTIKIDSCIKREVMNKLYNVKLKLLKVTNGYELIATYFINNEDLQCKILIHNNKRPTITTLRKDKFILKLNKLLEISNRYVEVLGLWKINLDNKMMGRKECLICYYIVDMKDRLPDYECKTCKNIFHVNCVDKYQTHSKNFLCPFCRNMMK